MWFVFTSKLKTRCSFNSSFPCRPVLVTQYKRYKDLTPYYFFFVYIPESSQKFKVGTHTDTDTNRQTDTADARSASNH